VDATKADGPAFYQALGTAVRGRRRAARLRLRELSGRTGVSVGHLSQIELGKTRATLRTLYWICAAFGIQLSDLFREVEAKGPPA
jgi:XRE family transcriptional regulator, regulator of sulfur utilization